MKPAAYMTTSWDDGHSLDLRVADLLAKHAIAGTFYVSKDGHRDRTAAADIRTLAAGFELGAHTLNHIVLTEATEQQAREQITGSKSWLEDITGAPCFLFCPPKGRYAARHLRMIQAAGFLGIRNCELVSLDLPRRELGVLVMPTTIQAYPHRFRTYARNALKRMALTNLWHFVVHGRSTDWPALANSLLLHALDHGGVFHLWGHSWEIEAADQWRRLDEVLRLMSWFAGSAAALTNGEICQRADNATAHLAGSDTAASPTSILTQPSGGDVQCGSK